MIVMIVYSVLLYCGAVLCVYGAWRFVQWVRTGRPEERVVMRIRGARYNENGPICAEQMFSALHGMRSRRDSVSFEIVRDIAGIALYAVFPRRLKNLVEGQIYAQYPEVVLEECADYISPGKGECVELSLIESDIFPIKRYAQFEDTLQRTAVDPLAGITSALVQCRNPGDRVWVQIVSSPLSERWRQIFVRCVRSVSRGVCTRSVRIRRWYANLYTTRNMFLRVVCCPLYFVFFVQGLFSGGRHLRLRHVEEVSERTSHSHDREDVVSAALDKVARLLFEVNIRIAYLPARPAGRGSREKLEEVVSAFRQFYYPYLNGFCPLGYRTFTSPPLRFLRRELCGGFVLNNEELASLFHVPTDQVKTPTLLWVESRQLEPPAYLPVPSSEVVALGMTHFRNHGRLFGFLPEDRRRHLYIVGKTGMGKSTLLENLLYSDISSGRGVGVIDPHGDLAEKILDFVPSHRINDVVYIDPADSEYAIGFNMLSSIDPSLHSIAASALIGVFQKLYSHSWGPRLEHILRNTILSLLAVPGISMLAIPKMLTDAAFRRRVILQIHDPVVRGFWQSEFETMSERLRIEAISPILNKVGQFLSSPFIRNVVGQPASSFDLQFCMDTGKIVIINLSKGRLGEDNSALLGALFVTAFQLNAMRRSAIPEDMRRDFYLYVDEFQNFATDSFATILSEARKYRLNLTVAHQYIAQMSLEVQSAVFGNVGSMIAFQIGAEDGELLSQQFGEQVLPADLTALPKYQAYMRLLVSGMPSRAFSLLTLGPPQCSGDSALREKIVRVSRERYSTPVSMVEERIRRFLRPPFTRLQHT